MLDISETIVAPASAPGPAARGIVRVSGEDTIDCVAAAVVAASRESLTSATSARAIPCQLMLDGFSSPCPCTIFVWPTARSYTRQPTVEIHAPGSPPIVDAIVRTLCQHGARLAKPGEFTLRAFLAGRIDLPRAEAVLGVIDAADELELSGALRQLAGGLSAELNSVRDRLLDLCTELEAGLDFADEDITFIAVEQIERQLAECETVAADLLHRMATRTTRDSTYRIVFVGAPNVGKSTLVNALAGAPSAIVSERAGTTRDYVTCQVELHGVHCELVDTAGIETRELLEGIESQAQRISAEQGQRAHLIIHCQDGTVRAANLPIPSVPHVKVMTKCDLPSPSAIKDEEALSVSAKYDIGLDRLRLAIVQALVGDASNTEVVASTAVRCRDAVESMLDSIRRARRLNRAEAGDELVSSEIRVALEHLGQMVGAVYTDDVLDRIFCRFCIGK